MLNYTMKYFAGLLVISFLVTSCTHTYYVIRHAGKETGSQGTMMASNDPPLSEAGGLRAEKLKEILADKKITNVFATNTVRAKSTAQPTANHFGVAIQVYSKTDSLFFDHLKKLRGNALIVGHSNTVKNIVNGLCNTTVLVTDLGDNEYGYLFTVRYKRFLGTYIKLVQRNY
jgi:phosphohistidine phosphatase SixA